MLGFILVSFFRKLAYRDAKDCVLRFRDPVVQVLGMYLVSVYLNPQGV